jgi:hypothetical protein
MRLLYIVFSIFLISCANRMYVERGTFQAIKPPNIYGNSRYLAKDTNYIISYDANIGKNKTIPLPGIVNSNSTHPREDANINYRLIENTLGFQFYRAIKNDYDFYKGFGGGLQNFPYGFLMIGHNKKFMEVGAAIFLGLTIDNASYEGKWDCSFFDSCGGYYTKLEDVYVLHPHGGIVTHVSFYFKKIALNYAASVSSPWLVKDLPIPLSGEGYADISFLFPVLLIQDIGISYMPNKIKYRFGINQITGVKFPGQYWGLSVQMAYGW